MLVRVGMAPRAPGLSIADAQHHWRTAHRDVALGLPGLRAYVQHHAVLDGGGRPLLPYPGFDVCATTEFDDREAMRAAFASEHYRSDVQADERSLIDKPRFMLALCERRVLIDGGSMGGDDPVELMTFMRAAAGATPEALHQRLAGEWTAAAAATAPLRHEQLIVRGDWHEGEPPPCCDAIDVLWYSSAAAALDAALGPLSADGGWALAGIAFGAERLIAAPIRQR